jgi:hypothetical protein
MQVPHHPIMNFVPAGAHDLHYHAAPELRAMALSGERIVSFREVSAQQAGQSSSSPGALTND